MDIRDYKTRWTTYDYHMNGNAWEKFKHTPARRLAKIALDRYCEATEESDPCYDFMIESFLDNYLFPRINTDGVKIDKNNLPKTRKEALIMLEKAGRPWLVEFIYASNFARWDISPAMTD